jgi:hypothetical protein
MLRSCVDSGESELYVCGVREKMYPNFLEK